MRATTTRLSVSLLGAAALHGAVFGVAAAVLSHGTGPRPAPVTLDVDVVEVTEARPDPIADSGPSPGLVPAKVVVPARRRPRESALPTRTEAVASGSATIDPAAAPDDSPGPSVAVTAPATAAREPHGPAAPAGSAGPLISAQPHYRSNPKPEYPLPSLRRQEEGVVLLTVVVQPDGSPAAITLNRSSGHPLLDKAALDAVRRWTFEPARAAGVPVSSTTVIPVRFSLTDQP